MPAVDINFLRELRHEYDLSIPDLAARLNISDGYLVNILCGADEPSMRVIHRFAREFNQPVDKILIAAGERTPQGDPSEPPVQPKNEPTRPPSRQDKEGSTKAPRKIAENAA